MVPTRAQKKKCRNRQSQTHACTQGGIGAVIAAMGRHIENPDVQDTACLALIGFADGHPENQAKIGAQVNIHECI